MKNHDRNAAREAFPGKSWDWWLVYDLVNDDMVPLETASDDMILSQADWFDQEHEFEYAHWLRAFAQWRRRRHLTVVSSAPRP